MQFLDKYDQLESQRQHDYVNMYLKKENEKFEKKQKIEQNKNLNNPNQNIKKSNVIIQNSGIEQSQTKKDDFSTNAKYNYQIMPKAYELRNQENDKVIKPDMLDQEKNPINSIKKSINNQNTNYLTQNINISNNATINENEPQINKNNMFLNNKINYNNEHNNNMNNFKEIYSPQIKKNNKIFIPTNNNAQILSSSKTNKTKQIVLNKN